MAETTHEPLGKIEQMLVDMINGESIVEAPENRIEGLLIELADAIAQGGGGGGGDVTGVKGSAESTYRKGNVNLTAENIGVEAGAEVNTIESITLNGTELTPDANKNVVITVITNTVNNLLNYYLKSETYTKAEVDNIANTIKNGRFEVAPTLPTTDIKTNVIYLVPKSTAQTDNVKDEYINLDGTTSGWEKIGDTEIDLSGYVKISDLNTALADYTTTTDLTTLLAGKVDKVTGKGLSTNDYTNTDKELVDSIPTLAPISLVKDTVGWIGKNLLKNIATTQTINSVTFTVNNDGSITVNGTGTNPNAGVRELNQHFTLPAGDYILSGSPHNVFLETGFRLQIYNWTDSVEVVKCETDEDVPFTIGENKDIAVRIWFRGTPSTGGNNITFYPMIRRADIIDDTYEPYHESVEAMHEEEIHGVNLNKGDASHTYIRGEGATAPYRTYNCPLDIPFAAGDKFIVSFDIADSANFDVSTSGIAMRFWGNNGASASEDWVVGSTNGHYEHTFSITQAGSYTHDLYFYLQQTETNPDATLTVKNLMIRKATIEDSAYRPYNHQAIQNQINDKGALGARNLLVPTKANGSGNGLTWTSDEDGIVTVTGQNTGQSSYYINILSHLVLPKGTYIFSGCPAVNSLDVSLFIRPNSTTQAIWGQDYGDSPKVMTLTEDTDLMGYIRVGGGVNVGTQVFKPMITLASDTQSNYANFTPYAMTNRELTEKVVDTDTIEVSSFLDSTYVSSCGSFRYRVKNGICFVYINNIKFTDAAIDVVDFIILPEGILPKGLIPASSMLWNKTTPPLLLGLIRNNAGDIKATVNGITSSNVNLSWYAASFSYPIV